jgi:CheY-like chemotaxis protein
MSLILAVEPDRKQAKQLSSVVRQHVKAEFVVADSGSAALAALGTRIPDLILTPALLPPKDEAVLTGWLRDLGDAAAHVQTLAIPILSEPSSRKDKDAGVSIFGRLRDQGPEDSGPGCDPSVFADQIRVYLDRVDSDRSSRVTATPAAPTVDLPSEVSMVAAASEEQAPDMEPFDEAVTFDDLVFDPSPSEPAPATAPVPVSEPPVVMRAPTPFARPDKRVEPAVLRSWESELGLDTAPPASPLWRASTEVVTDAPAAPRAAAPRVSSDGLVFDPADARYAPLFRRLDEIAGLHA